jgi:hypothetical protein
MGVGTGDTLARNAGPRAAGDAVDIVHAQASVHDRPRHRLDRQIQAGAAEPATNLRLTRAGDDGPATERPTRYRSGSVTAAPPGAY